MYGSLECDGLDTHSSKIWKEKLTTVLHILHFSATGVYGQVILEIRGGEVKSVRTPSRGYSIFESRLPKKVYMYIDIGGDLLSCEDLVLIFMIGSGVHEYNHY